MSNISGGGGSGGGAPATTLDDLTDVTITAPGDGELLVYDNGTSQWINQTLAEAGVSAVGHTHVAADVTDFSAAVVALLTDLNIPDNLTLTNITQITNRSHTNLQDIGVNTHAQIDTHIANAAIHYTDEQVDDRVAALIQNGTGISWTYDDAANTLTGNVSITQYTDEMAQDAISTLIQNGTGISWSYNDGANTLTPTVTLAPFSTTNLAEGANLYYTDERVDDRINALFVAGVKIDLTYVDGSNTFTVDVDISEGKSGGDNLVGGSGASENLTLESTSHATKGSVRSKDNFIIGNDAAGIDYTLTFAGETNDGVLTWMEDEDQFRFNDVGSFYRNDTSTSPILYVEQDSTGDATLSWLLTAGQEFRAYIDNSDSDSFKVDDQTGADTFVKYDPSTGTLNLGVIGDGTIGDGTERTWKPNTDLKTNWGASAFRFNEGWFAELYASANAVGDPVFTIKSTATNDDPTQICYQARAATTDATVTTLHTFTVPTSTTYMITAFVCARRTGGAGGAAEDGAGYVIRGTYKNTAGTVALIGAVSADYTAESQAGWDATFDVTGATVRCRVTGAASNNVTWHMTAYIWQVAS